MIPLQIVMPRRRPPCDRSMASRRARTVHASEPTQTERRSSRLAPNTLFYPAAALYAAVVLPLSVLSMTRVIAGPASLSTAVGHAHEMLAGYALAVVAGNQLPLMSWLRALLLFGLWVAARITFVVLGGDIALAFDVAFALAIAFHVAPRLFRAAKKLRNQALPVILVALYAAAAAYDMALSVARTASPRALLTGIVLLLTALMLFMGGRIIAPAAAGQLYRQGQSLTARVQPRIEGLLLSTMAAAVVFALVPGVDLLLRVACLGAGGLAMVRLVRWRLWACKGRPDIVRLAVGYAWLALGLLALAASAPGDGRTAALHLVTIGALGTLTLNVMANTMLVKIRRVPAAASIPSYATGLIATATLFRVAAAFVNEHAVDLLIVATVCWSGGFVGVLWLVLRSLRPTAKRERTPADPKR
jgi:uncharacterized protein involved in response to NO